jgi:tRNA(fMet)-specific endonuclease VapC
VSSESPRGLAVAAVTVAECRVGIELADSAERAAARARALTAIESVVDVLAYTDTTAAHHARLIAHVRRTGAPRGARDLIIAAHAAETGRTVLTRDIKASFAGLPGVLAIDTLNRRRAARLITRETDRKPAVARVRLSRGKRAGSLRMAGNPDAVISST